MHLHTLELYSSHIKQLYDFYGRVLECKVEELENGFTINTRLTRLIFRQYNGEINPVYHFAFTIPENQVLEALTWTASKVPLLELAPGQHLADFRNWDASAFYFFDPAGNIVEFIARTTLEIQNGTSFSGNALHSVSEIGIVTDDVSLATRQLAELWNVPLFSKQPPTPNFAAAGNDHGLFIIVSEGRNWYPTHTPAIKSPFTATFTSDDGIVRTLEIS